MTKKTTLLHLMHLIAHTLLISTSFTAPRDHFKFENAFLEDYPLDTPVPDKTNYIQKTLPSKMTLIKGTLKLAYRLFLWNDGGQMDFTIFFREASDTSYKNSLIMQFSIPYSMNSTYENKQVLYTPTSTDKRFLIKEKDIHIYELDPDFHVLTGEEISEAVNFRTFDSKIKVKLTGKVTKHGKKATITELEFFELYFEKGSQLHRMKILRPEEGGTDSDSTYTSILLLLIAKWGLLSAFAGNTLSIILSLFLADKNESYQFLGSFITSAFSPFYLTILFKDAKNGRWITALIIVIFCVGVQDVATYIHFYEMIKKGNNCNQRTRGVVMITVALNLAWIIVLFFQPWLLLRYYFFYVAIMLAVDSVVLAMSTKMRNDQYLKAAGMVALRGFFTELLFLNIYALVFYLGHGELPSIWARFVVVDFGLFLAVIVAYGLLSCMRRKGGVERAYSRELME